MTFGLFLLSPISFDAPCYPALPNYTVHTDDAAAHVYGKRRPTRWEELLLEEDPLAPFAPWRDEAEFRLVEWMVNTRQSVANINDFLKLSWVR